MSPHPSVPAARVALLATTLALALAGAAAPLPAQATPDLTIVVVICVPANAATMAAENKPLAAGVARQEGRDPPPRTYFCPVFNPDLTTTQASWQSLKLMYQDNTSAKGNIVVRLHAKSHGLLPGDPTRGSTFQLASVASVPAVGVNVVSAPLTTALDFSRFSYYLTLEMPTPVGHSAPVVDAHAVRLGN